jgi:hypothetical protein
MANTGLGQDGYVWYQKEAAFGTEIATTKIFVPAKAGSLIKSTVEMIENANIIQSRTKQAPNLGRQVVNGEVVLDAYPDMLGGLFELLLGGAATAGVVDSTYTHTWLVPITGENIGESATFGQAIGGDTEDRYDGVTVTGMSFSQGNDGNLELTLRLVGQDQSTNGGARATATGYSTAIPLNFSFATTITLTPNGASAIVVNVDSLELDIDLGYDLERFKLGSANIIQPVFNSIPTVTLSATVDAQRAFVDHARTHKEFDIDLSFVSTENAAGTTKYQMDVEISHAKLDPATEISFDNDRASMDLSFDCSYGGTTTGSSSTVVMAELRVVDAVATHT